MDNFIPFALPDIDENDIAEVVDTLRSNWITTGPKARAFEEAFSKYTGARYALAVNSATAALHLALESVGLRQGDKVITTPYTFAATAEVIRYFNADPVFIDVRKEDCNIDPAGIEKFCSEECAVKKGVLCHNKTGSAVKAIIPVHIGGVPCDMDAISRIAKKYGLKVIEDAAHALPVSYKGKRVGTISDITAFSFYATKTITTAEGGMAVTGDKALYERMKVMRLHGIDRDAWNRYSGNGAGWYYEIIGAGYKYNMTDIAASLGIGQLKKADSFYEKRKHIARIYNKGLKGIKGLELPPHAMDGSSWHLYIVKIDSDKVSRDDFIKKLQEKGIGTSVHFIPLHIQPYYRDLYKLASDDFPVAYDSYKKSVSLPIYTRLTDNQVASIVSAIKEIFA